MNWKSLCAFLLTFMAGAAGAVLLALLAGAFIAACTLSSYYLMK